MASQQITATSQRETTSIAHPTVLYVRRLGALGWVLCSESRKTEPKAGLLSGGSREESIFRLPQVTGRIYFLAAGGLGSPFPCWLSTGDLFQLLEVSCSFLPWAFSQTPSQHHLFKAGHGIPHVEPPSSFASLRLLLSARETWLPFSGTCDEFRRTWVISLWTHNLTSS